jgi:hypothetical protein
MEPESITGFAEAMNAMEVTGQSTRRWVSVRRSADRQIRVRFADGALAELRGGHEVAEEIRSALAAALADYDRQYFALRWHYFGSRLGDERGEPS